MAVALIRRIAITAAVSFACSAACAQSGKLIERWSVSGFSAPESALVDTQRQRLIVANINGSALAEDGNGFLSLLDLNGKVIDRHWIGGFDGPTGMAVKSDRLYVADIHRVRVVDLGKGVIEKTIDVDGAKYLNDVAVGPDGAIYVTDVVGDAIYRIENDRAGPWLSGSALSHPNGIVFDGKKGFLVAGWGKGMKPDFSTESPGALIRIDFRSKGIEPVSGGSGIGNLDGVALSGQIVYFTDNPHGRVLRLDPAGKLTEVAKIGAGAADLTVSNGMVFVPQLAEGRVTAFQLSD
jgi:sugar lactone lactonase YvrE